MKILLSNDDGILAPGLAALYHAIADMGEVWVVAPDSPQSAAGHAITLSRPLVVQKVHVSGPREFVGMSVSGRPADCVRLAIKSLLPSQPDIVLSGINAGANIGINVFYSGTVAAAAEAVMCGVPAIAFSASMAGGEVDFAKIASHCRKVLDRILAGEKLSAGDLINVNIPQLRPGWPTGVAVVRQSTSELEDSYEKITSPDGGQSYRLSDSYGFKHKHDATDVHSLNEGLITVTPLRVDMTCDEKMSRLAKIKWDSEK